MWWVAREDIPLNPRSGCSLWPSHKVHTRTEVSNRHTTTEVLTMGITHSTVSPHPTRNPCPRAGASGNETRVPSVRNPKSKVQSPKSKIMRPNCGLRRGVPGCQRRSLMRWTGIASCRPKLCVGRPERYSDGGGGQLRPSLEVHRRPIVGDDHGLTDDPWAQSGAGSSFRVIRCRFLFSGKDDEPTPGFRASRKPENGSEPAKPPGSEPAKPAKSFCKPRGPIW